ncbi:acetyl-CoA synthetase-like protein [Ceratobasidium sp. AG-Ba]|nr:acetyl-CoA synthetase-like protein [Ceratobasidium sp. AG-Ba]
MIAPASSFIHPPTDGSVPLNHIVDFHLRYNPQCPWVVLAATEDRPEVAVTYEQLAHAVHRAAHIINPGASIPQGTNVGILATADTIVYLTLILGISRAGLVPFPISPRTQLAGITHLLTKSHTPYVIIGGSPAILELRDNLVGSIDSPLNTIPVPTLTDLYPQLGKLGAQDFVPFPDVEPAKSDSIVAILHSSGSTGLPRPIPLHQEGVMCNEVQQPSIWEYGEPGQRVALMALPSFHAMAYILQYLGPLFTGYVPVLFAPSSPPTIPTAELTLQTLVRSGCMSLFTVPAFLETWARDEEAIKELAKLKHVTFGGGSLAQWVGDKLISYGVPVYSLYGSTEAGSMVAINPSNRAPSDWSFVEFSDQTDARFVEQHDAEGSCVLIFVECDGHKPFLYNCEIDGKRAYDTKDLVVPHPTKKGLWKFVGRLDDQIILLNGEKVNPGPMEDEIVKSPIVQYAAVFGRERNQTGVLIELTPDAQSRSLDTTRRAGLVEEIWPYMEKANVTSPTHARLDKWAVVFTHPDRPLPHTPKGTVPRSAAIKLYREDIEAMYASIEKGEEVDTAGPSDWTEEHVTKWMSDYVGGLLGRELNAEGDLFQQGLDSLTATLLARTLKSVLHRTPDSNVQRVGDKVNQQTVFAKPSIKQLVQHIVALSSDVNTTSPAEIHEAALESIKAMVQKHTPNRPSKSPRVQSPSTERIVLTGTTGALGSHLLSQLLQNEKVGRVWALNRKSRNADGMQRQRASFEDKNLDVKLLESGKLILAEADLTDGNLGLDDQLLEEIRASATAIIHNAWQVNFNLSLQSFEPSIVGAENLINLAFDSVQHPRLVFTSSISAAGVGAIGLSLPEEYIQFESVATGFGYGESKFVTEKMLESAQSFGLETCVVRLGQLTGDKTSGSWSPTDWVPSLIASSLSVGYLPDALGSISWIPLDDAATTVIDACLSREALLPPVIHCAHPRPIPWSRVMRMFSHIFEEGGNKRLELMPLAEWNQKVVEAASAISLADEAFKRYPSTKIQTTIDGMTHSDQQVRGTGSPLDDEFEAGGMARMSTTKAVGLSKALEKVGPLSQEHVRAWVAYWEERGLFL